MKKIKFVFGRSIAYVGLYAEIFSASCRWAASAPRGWRIPYKTFITRALKASGYIPPTQEEIDAANAQHRINSEYALLTFHGEQPETIQACLKFDPALFKKMYRNSKFHPQAYQSVDGVEVAVAFGEEAGAHVPAIPPFCKESEVWAAPMGPAAPAIPEFVEYSFKLPEDWADEMELDEDGYLRKKNV